MADTTALGLHVHILSIHNHSPIQSPRTRKTTTTLGNNSATKDDENS